MREIILKNETLSSNQYDADNSKGAYCILPLQYEQMVECDSTTFKRTTLTSWILPQEAGQRQLLFSYEENGNQTPEVQ